MKRMICCILIIVVCFLTVGCQNSNQAYSVIEGFEDESTTIVISYNGDLYKYPFMDEANPKINNFFRNTLLFKYKYLKQVFTIPHDGIGTNTAYTAYIDKTDADSRFLYLLPNQAIWEDAIAVPFILEKERATRTALAKQINR